VGAVILAGAVLGAGAATAVRPARTPLRIHTASLTQTGQALVWRVRSDDALDATRLVGDGRAVCLLRERVRSQAVVGELCVAVSRRGGRELSWAPRSGTGYGPARAVAASFGPATGHGLTVSFRPAAMGSGYTDLRWQVSSSLTSGTCRTSTGSGCRQLFPARPALARLHVPRLVGCVPSGASYITNGPRNGHDVALTFDDGPWYDTPQFFALLQRDHVPATFFHIGEQETTYGALDRKILAAGDLIGDHTWNHADVAGGGPFAAGEIAQARAAIQRETGGFTPCLFRAPGGAVSPGLISLARSMGFLTIEWDVDTRDWSRPGTGSIVSTVLNDTRNGSIVLQHEGGGDRSETLAALPTEIATLRRRGYRFVTLAGLLGLRLIYK
jgi:peptidoglycan/xylan/chitin deacetylase (PgdA/CDA1 family)